MIDDMFFNIYKHFLFLKSFFQNLLKLKVTAFSLLLFEYLKLFLIKKMI